MTIRRPALLALTAILVGGVTAYAQAAQQDRPSQPAASSAVSKKSKGGPAPLVILFDIGSSRLGVRDNGTLDRASRAFSEGKPIVMIVTGGSDLSGSPQANLTLSQQRATAVVRGLLDRGIPADRFQVLAKGQTEPSVPTAPGVAELQNRRVEISWH